MNTTKIYTESPSILCHRINALRQAWVEKNHASTQAIVEEIGSLMAYEISKELSYEEVSLKTPLGQASGHQLAREPVVATVLRAGLPLQRGFLKVFGKADGAFLMAYRKHESSKSHDFEVQLDAVTCPDLNGRVLILTDTMLATGRSITTALQSLLQYGQPKEMYLASVVASEQGVRHLQNTFPSAKIRVVVVDPKLNAASYIVPGIGDAGDLMYGEKLQN